MTDPTDQACGAHRITRRAFAQAALAAGSASALVPSWSRAQPAYPTRPVRVILPFAAGGQADITSRFVAERLGEKLGQRFVIENQPGPGGIVAARSVLSAAPDGYTLGLATNGTSISVAIYNALPFDPVRDFVTISTLGYFDLVFATNSESPFRTLPDFIKAVREEPGKLNIGTIAIGSTQELGAELFKASAKLEVQIVPYRTTPDVIVGLFRNDVQLMVDFYAPMQAALEQNRIRAVATSGMARTEYLSAVPVVSEAGVPGYEVTAWNGLFAPKGTPAAIISLLNRSVGEVLAVPDIKSRFATLGITAKASTPEELKSRMQGDIGKWAAVIERAGIPKQ
ncbi:MAG TPA: tripartite tricarboxylate transporter substrate-binding protein [Xanthobacteraceae bacterium]|jgi:tripartite-type tricarboxylate transporter receptor subunit TctC